MKEKYPQYTQIIDKIVEFHNTFQNKNIVTCLNMVMIYLINRLVARCMTSLTEK